MNNKFLVYSSIGDRTRFTEFWLNGPDKRRFDPWMTYRGEMIAVLATTEIWQYCMKIQRRGLRRRHVASSLSP